MSVVPATGPLGPFTVTQLVACDFPAPVREPARLASNSKLALRAPCGSTMGLRVAFLTSCSSSGVCDVLAPVDFRWERPDRTAHSSAPQKSPCHHETGSNPRLPSGPHLQAATTSRTSRRFGTRPDTICAYRARDATVPSSRAGARRSSPRSCRRTPT